MKNRELLPEHLFWEPAWTEGKQAPYRETFSREGIWLPRGGRWTQGSGVWSFEETDTSKVDRGCCPGFLWPATGRQELVSLALSHWADLYVWELVTAWLGFQRRECFYKWILHQFSWRSVAIGLFSASLWDTNVRLAGRGHDGRTKSHQLGICGGRG